MFLLDIMLWARFSVPDLRRRGNGIQVLFLRNGSDVLLVRAMLSGQRLYCEGPRVQNVQGWVWWML